MRARFAPSPTGYLHIGGAWMTFFNWLFARSQRGAFVLRIEDTDRSRSTREYETTIYEDLHWLGLDWDEGPDIGGPYGPYRQTERAALYTEHAERLLASGDAYHCWCTPEELEAEKRAAEAERRPYRYSRRCLRLTAAERAQFAAEGRTPTVRFHVQRTEPIGVDDMILGAVTFDPADLDDFIIVRSDGTPLYNFANAIDDHAMAITHILRGREHLSNTPRQWLIYAAFGWEMPRVGHLPTLLGADRKKLSKRHGDTALREYRDNLFLPEALVNFFALMGWYPEDGRELFSMDELLARFSIEQMGKSNPFFDLQKLTWMNGVYMRRLEAEDPERVIALYAGYLQRAGLLQAEVTPAQRAYLGQVIAILGERLKVGQDVFTYGEFFFTDRVEFEPAAVAKHLRDPGAPRRLAALRQRLAAAGSLDPAAAEAALRATADALDLDARALIHAARVALSGRTIGPGLFEMIAVLGRERVLRRLDEAILMLEAMPAG